jgi:hypothetical protein
MIDEQQSEAPAIVTDFFVITAELERRFANMQRKYHLCPNRMCRRLRRCVGEGTPCSKNPMPRSISNKEAGRVHRAVQRARRSRRRW